MSVVGKQLLLIVYLKVWKSYENSLPSTGKEMPSLNKQIFLNLARTLVSEGKKKRFSGKLPEFEYDVKEDLFVPRRKSTLLVVVS